ncbi:helix-turn-helix transcriptional regulator [Streptococcus cuniculi]|uniref:XRE family transcriptional regulator n=1 Tax=Streptococcus cuniculi TaxID=1432788 RepID=A0A4Y9J9W1_9STRE|nr:helix-turn-helix transcriptional regulator [Streptococcus cuniculi]MBF0778328.1 helix-turn-helix transcriptional regulator [Streptococcus cuniculi]TFU97820.1 XRE family transcriptional regulator [Streptococcus cuniculi]
MNRLKELRKEKGLTQQGLADIVGVTKRTIIAWENGERDIKSDKAQTLADYFGVSVGKLLGYETFSDDVFYEVLSLRGASDYEILRQKIEHEIFSIDMLLSSEGQLSSCIKILERIISNEKFMSNLPPMDYIELNAIPTRISFILDDLRGVKYRLEKEIQNNPSSSDQ